MQDTSRETNPRVSQYIIAGVVIILLAFPIALRVLPNLLKSTKTPDTESLPLMFPAEDLATKRVIKTATATVVNYWLFGRILTVDGFDGLGAHITFVLDGDPFKTKLRGLILSDEGKFKVYWYDSEFGGEFKMQLIDEKVLKSEVLESGALLEFRVPFVKNQLSSEDLRTMQALEGPNADNWQTLPRQTTLKAEIIGIVKKK